MFLCIECGKNFDENSFYRKVRYRFKDSLNKKFKCNLCGKFFCQKTVDYSYRARTLERIQF